VQPLRLLLGRHRVDGCAELIAGTLLPGCVSRELPFELANPLRLLVLHLYVRRAAGHTHLLLAGLQLLGRPQLGVRMILRLRGPMPIVPISVLRQAAKNRC
jgi:hypothetical protein